MAWPAPPRAHDNDRIRLPAKPPPRPSERGKKEVLPRTAEAVIARDPPRTPRHPRPRTALVDARTAREPSADHSNKSAKVVLEAPVPSNQVSGASRNAGLCPRVSSLANAAESHRRQRARPMPTHRTEALQRTSQSRVPIATSIGRFSSMRRACSNDTVRSSCSSTQVYELPGDPPNSWKMIWPACLSADPE